MGQKVHFSAQHFTIEGVLSEGNSDRGVVITHPHPLYGGDMNNSVVETISRAYREKDYTTLKFNFRGTGRSEGNYGGGIGEQKDVIAALTYLHESGLKTIDLAGYSFGAWVNALLCSTPQWEHPFALPELVMVSPPVGFLDFKEVERLPGLKLVISGSEDEIVPMEFMKTKVPQWNGDARLEIISGADHFYFEHLDALHAAVISCL